jgi:hypothetical protein
MEVKAKAAGGRAVAAHFGCCVFCALCCGASGLLATNGSAKMADFCMHVDKKASRNLPNVKALQKSSWCEDFDSALRGIPLLAHICTSL